MDPIDKHIKKAYDRVDFEFDPSAWSEFNRSRKKAGVPSVSRSWMKYAALLLLGLFMGVSLDRGLLYLDHLSNNTDTKTEGISLSNNHGDKKSNDLSLRDELEFVDSTVDGLKRQKSQSSTRKAIKEWHFDRIALNTGGSKSIGTSEQHKAKTHYGLTIEKLYAGHRSALKGLIKSPFLIEESVRSTSSRVTSALGWVDRYIHIKNEVEDFRIPIYPPEPNEPRIKWYAESTILVSSSTIDIAQPTFQISGGLQYRFGPSYFLRGGLGIKHEYGRVLHKRSTQLTAEINGVSTYNLSTKSTQLATGTLAVGRSVGDLDVILGVQPSYLISSLGTIRSTIGDEKFVKQNTFVSTDGLSPWQWDIFFTLEGKINPRLRWQARAQFLDLNTNSVNETLHDYRFTHDRTRIGAGIIYSFDQ